MVNAWPWWWRATIGTSAGLYSLRHRVGWRCYDVARQITEGGRFIGETYVEAFGSDPARPSALSLTIEAATLNAPAFLIAHIDRANRKVQSEALAEALVQAGTLAEVYGIDGKGLLGHLEIKRSLRSADYTVTAIVDTWLHKLLLWK